MLFLWLSGLFAKNMLIKNSRALLIGATIITGVCAAFSLITNFSQGSLLLGLFEVSAPTSYDGNSYFNEIINYVDFIQAGAITELVKSYGALVVVLYSPCIIFGIKYWPLFVNLFLMGFSLFNYFAIFDASSRLCPMSLSRSSIFGLLGLIILISALDPFYIGSYLVPSKDIVALFLVSSLGFGIASNNLINKDFGILSLLGTRGLGRILMLALILAAMFFTRISIFLGSCFYFISAGFAPWNIKQKNFPVLCYLFSYISTSLLSLLVAGDRIPFQSEGGFFNSILLTPLKLLLAPAMPAIYSLWDLFKPAILDGSLNIVLFSFSLVSIPLTYLVFMLYNSYVFPLCVKKYTFQPSNNILAFSSSILGSALANTYVHPRYIYEVMPLLAISLFFRFPNFFRPSKLFIAMLLIVLLKTILVYQPFVRVAADMPAYVLPPFLN